MCSTFKPQRRGISRHLARRLVPPGATRNIAASSSAVGNRYVKPVALHSATPMRNRKGGTAKATAHDLPSTIACRIPPLDREDEREQGCRRRGSPLSSQHRTRRLSLLQSHNPSSPVAVRRHRRKESQPKTTGSCWVEAHRCSAGAPPHSPVIIVGAQPQAASSQAAAPFHPGKHAVAVAASLLRRTLPERQGKKCPSESSTWLLLRREGERDRGLLESRSSAERRGITEVTRPLMCSTFKPQRRGISRHLARRLVPPGATRNIAASSSAVGNRYVKPVALHSATPMRNRKGGTAKATAHDLPSTIACRIPPLDREDEREQGCRRRGSPLSSQHRTRRLSLLQSHNPSSPVAVRRHRRKESQPKTTGSCWVEAHRCSAGAPPHSPVIIVGAQPQAASSQAAAPFHPEVAKRITATAGVGNVEDLGRYLGIPSIHGCVTHSLFGPNSQHGKI
nr:hypothetical protein Itr_chr03CG08990 [Ipomoea trifida]